MKAPYKIQAEMCVLRDLADDSGCMWRTATLAQLGRINEVFRRVMGENPPRLVRVRAVAVLYGYDPDKFRTTEQLSLQGAGAFITWAFVPHKSGADLDTVPLREGAIQAIQWVVNMAHSGVSAAEMAEDEERRKDRQRQRARERYTRKKREAASLRPQGQPALS